VRLFNGQELAHHRRVLTCVQGRRHELRHGQIRNDEDRLKVTWFKSRARHKTGVIWLCLD
jgi:hypothetical protein